MASLGSTSCWATSMALILLDVVVGGSGCGLCDYVVDGYERVSLRVDVGSGLR